MPTTIKLKNSVTTTNAPSSLVQGEVAINITDKKVWVGNAATTPIQLLGDGGSVNFTTVDTTNLQVTNIKAKDGTASASIANSTGAFTVAAAFAANGGATLGDASGDALTINSSAVSIPNGLNFDSNTLVIDAANNRVGVNNATPTTALDVTGTATISTNLAFTGTGNRITGDFSNATLANRVAFQTSTTNGATSVIALPNGTARTATFSVYADADPTNSSIGQLFINSSEVRLSSTISGTGTYLPITFYTGGSERMRITSAGEVLVGGTTAILATDGLTIQKTTQPELAFFKDDTTVGSSNYFGTILFYGNDTTSNIPTVHAYIRAVSSGPHGAGDNPTEIVFATTPDGTSTVTEAITIKDGGGLEISRTAVTAPATGDGNVFSGTYTPTLTNTTNVAASTSGLCQYMRVGNVVTVSGQLDIDPTAATSDTILGMSLPIASNFSGQTNAGGTFYVLSGTVSWGGSIYGDSVNDRVTFRMYPADATNRAYQFTFTYRVI